MSTLNLAAYKPVSGTSGDANQIANGFTAIEAVVNSLTNANVNAAAAIDVSKLAAGTNGFVLTTTAGVPVWAAQGGTVPTGAIMMWATTTAPSGYVLCDGTSYLRSGGGVDALFAVIGTGYGSVDGTHFNVPDMLGRVPVGKGTHVDVDALADSDGIATVGNRRPKHKTSVNAASTGITIPYQTSGGSSPFLHVADAASSSSFSAPITDPTHTHTAGPQTGAEPTDTVAYLVVNFIIKT